MDKEGKCHIGIVEETLAFVDKHSKAKTAIIKSTVVPGTTKNWNDKFKIDGSSLRYPTNRFTLISQAGNTQLDDKNEYTVATDNIARPVTNFEHEIQENEKNREIDVLQRGYLTTFINDMRDIVRYDRHSRYINGRLSSTELTDLAT